MKNVTLQLFEYLLAAGNSNLSVHDDLNQYPTYWFLDEILSFNHIKLENVEGKSTTINLYQPDINGREIEVSQQMSAILNLLQYHDIEDDQPLLSKDELEKNLLFEAEMVKRKIEDESNDVILVNDWQQLLLGVNQAQISMNVAIHKQERLDYFIEQIVKEYQAWQDDIEQKKNEQVQLLKAQALYEEMLNFSKESDSTNKMNLGIGILHLPEAPCVYHPLLTLGIEVVVNEPEATCQLIFEDQSLVIDEILNHVLFCDLEVVDQMQLHMSEMKVSPFDDNLVATILQKIIKYIHPDGRYFASPVDAALAPEGIPQVLHRSVLFIREEQSYDRLNKLKSIVAHLSNDDAPSDVIGSIVDPNYDSLGGDTSYGIEASSESLFAWSTTDGIEEQMLNLLDEHHAVAVFEEEKGDKSFTVANLLTHLMATGKRVLVVGEEEEALDKIKAAIPLYLSGLHSKLSTGQSGYQKLKEDLDHLLDKKDDLSSLATDKVNDEIQQINTQLAEITKRIIDYRALGSKKIFWKDKRYHPYELAQLISKLGGKDYLDGDCIPLETRFDMKDAEIQKLWKLRPYFTPENMALLNYDFIDLNELNNYHEYQKMLALEEKYLQLSENSANVEGMFDQTTDIRFIQYLFDQLPKLMKDVAEIKTPYGKKILKEALLNLDNYHTLASSLDHINQGIKDMALFDGSNEERSMLIGKLNQLFDLSLSDLPPLDLTNRKQLPEFYTGKRAEMTGALRTAHLILIFNEGAMALSNNFRGISVAGIDEMNVLYHAAALHLSKVEFEICWFRVKSHFIRIYQPLIQQAHIHPVCVDLYEALANDHIDEFREVLKEVENLTNIRQNFVTFGNFIDQISDMMPAFTTSIMSDENVDTAVIPNFKEAIDKGKLNGLFDQLQRYESEFLDQSVEELKACLATLQRERIEKESWKNCASTSQNDLLKINQALEGEKPLNDKEINTILRAFPVLFMPLNEAHLMNNLDPNLFDLTLFVDASSSNIMRITEFMHAHKAILFGNGEDDPVTAFNLREEDFKKLANRYGRKLQRFGEQYLEDSLFNLITHSAAWDSQVKLPKQVTQIPIESIGEHIRSGIKRCESPIEDEIFEALMKMGYDVKCKVKVGKVMLDFLVVGKSNALAINVVGDTPMQREAIKSQIEQEMALRRKGLNIRTIQAAHFYLHSRQTLLDLYDALERLEIYPLKK